MFAWLNWPKQSGKTSLLAQMIKEDPNALLLTHSRMEASRIQKQYDLDPRQVMAYSEYGVGWGALKGPRTLVIDNLDKVLQIIFRDPVVACTTTLGEVVPLERPGKASEEPA